MEFAHMFSTVVNYCLLMSMVVNYRRDFA